MAEILFSAALQVLFERLTSPEFLKFLRRKGLDSQIKDWQRRSLMIQKVLADAEEKQLTNPDVKDWLDELQELAYDVEDLLDEFATEGLARARKLKKKHSKLHLKESEIKHVTSRFEELCELRDKLGLQVVQNRAGGTSAAADQRLTPTSVPTESVVIGREADKSKILEMVLNDDGRKILEGNTKCIISIFGMPGMGKSTLAREVYRAVGSSFQLKVWACVSTDFDVPRISKEILRSIKDFYVTQNQLQQEVAGNLGDLNFDAVQNRLKQVVDGKKFLLVLDDVWEKNYSKWEALMSPFKAAAGGSKIMVTTRGSDVATTMGRRTQCYELKFLSNEECWSLFKVHALPNDDHPDNDSIRQKVIQYSKRLPLASKTLGGLLGSKPIDEWLKILNSKMWDLVKGIDIPATLKLSYYYLPFHLKRCFAHCAILLEDYEFGEEELVFLWIAEGLIQRSEGKTEDLIGHDYFDDLLSRSFFQRSNSNESKYVMHDLFRDLAKWASGGTCSHLEDISEANKQPERLKKVRHLSYASGRYEGKCKFEVLERGDHQILRTFLPMSSNEFPYSFISPTVISDLLPKFKKLRTLSLKNYCIKELPEWLGDLRLMRFLNLSGTLIKSLPETTSSLFNLKILKLKGCYYLEKLPSKMGNLINLQHLDIRGTKLIHKPLRLNGLECLTYLSNFAVGKDVGAGLKDLMNFNFLCKKLCISKLENAVDTGEMILHDKDLKALQLRWVCWFGDTPNDVRYENVLSMLRPHPNLQTLVISHYGGKRFPSWVGDKSFHRMVTLTLKGCEGCIVLPSLGLLGSLKHLTIQGMKRLKSVGKEICGEHCSTSFQALQTLLFYDLPQWEHWEPTKENQYGGAFPSLKEFGITNCPKLSGRLLDRLPSLEKLVIERCEQLVISISSLPVLCKLKINGCKGVECNSPTDFKSLKFMTVANIDCLQIMNGNFLEKPPQGKGLQSFNSITELSIDKISNLVSFPEVCSLSNLSKLEIINCHALTFIVRGQLPCSLKRLKIQDCKKLEYLWDDKEESCTSMVEEEKSNNTSTSLLEYLDVFSCPSLMRLSSSGHLPRMLRTLSLESVPELESIAESFHTNKSLEEIIMRSCHNLKSMPAYLHNLNRLRKIYIDGCESIECLAEEEEGLPNTNFSELTILRCEKLKALPNRFHSLNSLKSLTLKGCPSMSSSFLDEGFPTNLTYLGIDCEEVEIYKPLLEWGLHKLTSLTHLEISGLPEAESFSHQEIEMSLPSSLTFLAISGFPNLKCLLAEGFRNLNSLEYLAIYDCPNFRSFPEQGMPSSLSRLVIADCPEFRSFPKQGLPSSLSRLYIWKCPKLRSFPKQGLPSSLSQLYIRNCGELRSFPKQGLPPSLLELFINDCQKLNTECKRERGKKRSMISHIPCVTIDGTSI